MIALDRTRLIAGSGFSGLAIVCFQSSIFSRLFSVVHISMVAPFERQYVGCGDVRHIDDLLADIVEESSPRQRPATLSPGRPSCGCDEIGGITCANHVAPGPSLGPVAVCRPVFERGSRRLC